MYRMAREGAVGLEAEKQRVYGRDIQYKTGEK